MPRKKLHRVLVLDDDEVLCRILRERLQEWDHKVEFATTMQDASQRLKSLEPHLIIVDVDLGHASSGLEWLDEIRDKRGWEGEALVITGHHRIDLAVDAMKRGARDFITKPIDYDQLEPLLDEIREEFWLEEDARRTGSKLRKGELGFGKFIGAHPKVSRVFELIESAAPADVPVLITGESGTGKELVARTIHQLSSRSQGPLVTVNMAAVPEDLLESQFFGHEKGAFTGAHESRIGSFEQASGGTLFLDEIGEMPVSLQPKLLRVLENHRVRRVGGQETLDVDFRILAATNRDPKAAVQEGKIREDLFFRLNVINITLPPLRERGKDVLILAQHFIDLFNEKHGQSVRGVGREAQEVLVNHDWPGNVRELKNVVERAVVLSPGRWLEPGHLPPHLVHGRAAQQISLPVGTSLEEAERRLITSTYEASGQNKTKTAEALGLDVKTVRTKLDSYGIK